MIVSPGRVRVALRCSRLAYEDNPRAALRDAGIAHLATYGRGNTQAILAFAGGDIVLAYRGTSELGDWVDDARYVKTDFPRGGRVHTGFFEQFMAIDSDVRSDLHDFQNFPLLVTGHSLGAALATIAGVAYRAEAGAVFGSPRVGNSGFAAQVRYSLLRFEHGTDPVTWVPPRQSPAQALHALLHLRMPTLYVHAGAVQRVDGDLHTMSHYERSVSQFLERLDPESGS